VTDDELEQVAARARAAIDVPSARVSDPFSEQARAAIRELTDLMASTGLAREVAEAAVTDWILTRRPIREVVADYRRRA
jgi:hypothetical protein